MLLLEVTNENTQQMKEMKEKEKRVYQSCVQHSYSDCF